MPINWEAVGAIAEIGGALVVIFTLIYLARQIRLSNRIAIANTEIEVRNAFGTINESVYSNPAVAELFVKVTDPDAKLSPAEEVQVFNIVLRFLNSWLAIETAYANKMVPKETYELIEDNIRVALNLYPGMSEAWREALEGFPALSERDVFRTVKTQLEG
jgi:hypothetical protein